jgi:hypothetical protein
VIADLGQNSGVRGGPPELWLTVRAVPANISALLLPASSRYH